MVKNVFILSSGHSGSTLLNLILGAHSRITAVSELTNLPVNLARNLRCTCGSPIRECKFWRDVSSRLRSSLHVDILRSPYQLNLGFMGGHRPADSPAYGPIWKARHAIAYLSYRTGMPILLRPQSSFSASIRNTLALYDAIRLASGSEIVVDASKGYLKGIGIYQSQPKVTKLLLLTRDGRASYYSRLKRGVTREASLSAWRDYYAHAQQLLGRIVAEEDLARVRYEDLASSPMSEVRRICEFLGLEFESQMLRFYETAQHSVGGNNMRFFGNREIRLDSSWVDGISQEDLLYFEKRAGRLNKSLGYR